MAERNEEWGRNRSGKAEKNCSVDCSDASNFYRLVGSKEIRAAYDDSDDKNEYDEINKLRVIRVCKTFHVPPLRSERTRSF